jgi:hypothetical protein
VTGGRPTDMVPLAELGWSGQYAIGASSSFQL